MNFQFDPGVVLAFLLIMTRMLTVLSIAPPFGGLAVPVQVRLAVSAAVALAVAPGQPSSLPIEIGPLITAITYQVVVGSLFGFLIQMLLAAPLVGGILVDNLAGFAAATLFDPLSNAAATPVGRLNQLLTTVILVVLDGHLLIIRGVLRSYEVAPLDGFRVEALGPLLAEGSALLLLAALEITVPLLVAMLLTEVVLGLAVKAAPRLNVMVIGFAIKAFVLMLTFALSVPLLINGVAALLDRSARWAVRAAGG